MPAKDKHSPRADKFEGEELFEFLTMMGSVLEEKGTQPHPETNGETGEGASGKSILEWADSLQPSDVPGEDFETVVLAAHFVNASCIHEHVVSAVATILRRLEAQQTFGTYAKNRDRCKVINMMADFFGVVFLCLNKKTGEREAIRMRCVQTSRSPDHHGHFQASSTGRLSAILYSGRTWPELCVKSRLLYHADLIKLERAKQRDTERTDETSAIIKKKRPPSPERGERSDEGDR